MKLSVDLGETNDPILAVSSVWYKDTKTFEVIGIYLFKYFLTINIKFK